MACLFGSRLIPESIPNLSEIGLLNTTTGLAAGFSTIEDEATTISPLDKILIGDSWW